MKHLRTTGIAGPRWRARASAPAPRQSIVHGPALAILLLAAALPGTGAHAKALCQPQQQATPAGLDRYRTFRDDVIRYVRTAAAPGGAGGTPPASPDLDVAGRWSIQVTAFRHGEARGTGAARGQRLSAVLNSATREAVRRDAATPLNAERLKATRFLVTFHYPPERQTSVIGYRGQGLEWVGDTVPLRRMTRAMVVEHLEHAKQYLLRIMNPVYHGFPKFYDARHDAVEGRLRTIYTASSLYTLLKLDAWRPDPAIERQIRPIADFILSMQCTAGPCRGGFYYALDPHTGERQPLVVVGTASKTIFTLLDLWRTTHDKRYLDAATAAGDWLLTMQKPDGRMNAALVRHGDSWMTKTRFSLLYNGQVLSALSRLAAVTHDARYKKAAGRIAALFMADIQKNGPMLGDQYRIPNSVSTSWVARSLLDYVQIDPQPRYRRAIYDLFSAILKRQANDPFDPYTYGSFYDDRSSSGTGWVNEVMADVYKQCKADGRADCARFKDAMLKDSRWLLQRTYTPANAIAVRNPGRADGGAIRDYMDPVVRTDAVCHGTNSLLGLLDIAGTDLHLNVPQRPFTQYLEDIRRGR